MWTGIGGTDGVAVLDETVPLHVNATPEEDLLLLARLHLLPLVADARLQDLPPLRLVRAVALARDHPRRHVIVVPAQ